MAAAGPASGPATGPAAAPASMPLGVARVAALAGAAAAAGGVSPATVWGAPETGEPGAAEFLPLAGARRRRARGWAGVPRALRRRAGSREGRHGPYVAYAPRARRGGGGGRRSGRSGPHAAKPHDRPPVRRQSAESPTGSLLAVAAAAAVAGRLAPQPIKKIGGPPAAPAATPAATPATVLSRLLPAPVTPVAGQAVQTLPAALRTAAPAVAVPSTLLKTAQPPTKPTVITPAVPEPPVHQPTVSKPTDVEPTGSQPTVFQSAVFQPTVLRPAKPAVSNPLAPSTKPLVVPSMKTLGGSTGWTVPPLTWGSHLGRTAVRGIPDGPNLRGQLGQGGLKTVTHPWRTVTTVLQPEARDPEVLKTAREPITLLGGPATPAGNLPGSSPEKKITGTPQNRSSGFAKSGSNEQFTGVTAFDNGGTRQPILRGRRRVSLPQTPVTTTQEPDGSFPQTPPSPPARPPPQWPRFGEGPVDFSQFDALGPDATGTHALMKDYEYLLLGNNTQGPHERPRPPTPPPTPTPPQTPAHTPPPSPGPDDGTQQQRFRFGQNAEDAENAENAEIAENAEMSENVGYLPLSELAVHPFSPPKGVFKLPTIALSEWDEELMGEFFNDRSEAAVLILQRGALVKLLSLRQDLRSEDQDALKGALEDANGLAFHVAVSRLGTEEPAFRFDFGETLLSGPPEPQERVGSQNSSVHDWRLYCAVRELIAEAPGVPAGAVVMPAVSPLLLDACRKGLSRSWDAVYADRTTPLTGALGDLLLRQLENATCDDWTQLLHENWWAVWMALARMSGAVATGVSLSRLAEAVKHADDNLEKNSFYGMSMGRILWELSTYHPGKLVLFKSLRQFYEDMFDLTEESEFQAWARLPSLKTNGAIATGDPVERPQKLTLRPQLQSSGVEALTLAAAAPDLAIRTGIDLIAFELSENVKEKLTAIIEATLYQLDLDIKGSERSRDSSSGNSNATNQ